MKHRKTTPAICSEEGNWIGGLRGAGLLPAIMRLLWLELQLPPDSQSCLFRAKSRAYGVALPNPTERSVTNDGRRESHYYLDVLKTQSAAPPGSAVIDQALKAASRGPLQISLCQSLNCVYRLSVGSKRGESQQVVQSLLFPQH